MVRILHSFAHDDAGATSIEYAMIAAVVAIIAIGGMIAFANANNGLYDEITAAVTATGGGS